ncbi:MAG: BamA/TamA family outer membrane protein [Leptolyngbyaceae cyanobacterium SM1_1_3]|nr:BamA/TamA family outer membrane protein [Leptolyngbyaceae cyanobacterium SM1_1_3]NJN01707.1 BamA/TamA family outer membrane protein [Leptolyngbyaceae cyanobacterium RM1_1_2]
MRLSPALLAVFTVSTAIGLGDRAQALSRPGTKPPAAELLTVGFAAPTGSQPEVFGEPAAVPRFSDTQPAIAQIPDNPTTDNPPSEILPGDNLPADELPVEVDDLSPSAPDSPAPEIDNDVDQPELPQIETPEIELDDEAFPDDLSIPSQSDTPETIEPEVEAAPDELPISPDTEQPSPPPPDADQAAPEPRVLVAEVAVEGQDPQGAVVSLEQPLADGETLEDKIYRAVQTRAGQTTTRTQLQRDINNIFATGYFADVQAVPEDTPLGVRVTFLVQPNPVLQAVEVRNNQVLPETVVDEIFQDQYGRIINLLDFQDSILRLNKWYQDNGYVLAQVTAAPQVSLDGVVTLIVAEGVIEDIEVRFISDTGDIVDEEGNPIDGYTRDFIITREFQSESGTVFQQQQIQRDLERVFGLGIFENVQLSLEPGDQDPRQVDVIVNVTERSTGSIAAGLGFNFTGDLFGTVSYRQDNFGGNNQKLAAEAQLSFRDLLFDISFTDPWIAGDPFRTSYTVNAFARRATSLVFDNGPTDVDLPNGDNIRVGRIGGGISFSRPLSNGWRASLGTQIQRVTTQDADGETAAFDALGNPLTISDDGSDDLWTVQFGLAQDRRNDALNPTSGYVLRLGTEQSIPLGGGSIFLNRLRASYSRYVPVNFLRFNEGPQALAFNIQGGHVLGDLPPYEAFALGGTNSVRGYDEGEVASGRSYVQASAEYRFPLFAFLGGALFLDYATDLGSGDAVPGSPGPVRDKPGDGFGYGVGVRVQTPFGPIRVDYGLNDQGDGRLHFGIGERF